MPYCPYCGKETPEGRFCASCGAALNSDPNSICIKSADANKKTIQLYNRSTVIYACVAILAAYSVWNYEYIVVSTISFLVFLSAGLYCYLHRRIIEKSKITVYNNRVIFCCPVERFQVRNLEVKMTDITNVSISSSFHAQDVSVVLSTTGGTFTVPVNDAPAICQAIKEQMETLKQAEQS